MISFANLLYVLLTYLIDSLISLGFSYEFNVVYVQREKSQYLLYYNNMKYTLFYICLFVAANFHTKNTRLRDSTWWERDKLINQSKYIIGSGRKQPTVFYNKNCSWKCRYIHKKIPVLESLVNIAEFLRSSILKNICKRQLLSDAISTQSIQSNLAFAQPFLLKFLFQNENIKIIPKIVNLEKKKKKKKSRIYNLYVMIYYEIQWFY